VKVVEVHVIGVRLRRVEAGVAQQGLQRRGVAAALPKKPIREPVSQLMRSQGSDARALGDTSNEPPESLLTGGTLCILPPPNPLQLRRPLLDLDGKHMVVRLGL